MRSSHSVSSSLSLASGSIGEAPALVFAGVVVASSALGVSSNQSTRSTCRLPTHAVRFAALGPKPARQKIRSTIAGVMLSGSTGVGGGDGLGDGLGLGDGDAVGLAVGDAVGLAVGDAVGLAVGDAVGLAV